MRYVTWDLFIRSFGMHSLLIPAVILCYIPMYDLVKFSFKKIILAVTVVLCIYLPAAAYLCVKFYIPCNMILFPASVIFYFLFKYTVNATHKQAFFVFLTATALISFTSIFTYLVDAVFHPTGSSLLFSKEALYFFIIVNISLILALYLPMKTKLNWMIKTYLPDTAQQLLWPIPFLFILLHFLSIPTNYQVLHNHSLLQFYFAVNIITSLFMLILYVLIYSFMQRTYENEFLYHKNAILELEVNRYTLLRNHMKETRQLRHDFRQQLHVIKGLVDQKEYQQLQEYLNQYSESIPKSRFFLCDNAAVDALASYYEQQAQNNHIKTTWKIDLPETLPISEIDLSIALGNLLENAIEGSLTLPDDQRNIRCTIGYTDASILLLQIENDFYGQRKKQSNSIYYSTKHSGTGIGLQSVQDVVNKYHGKIYVKDEQHHFSVKILLNLGY